MDKWRDFSCVKFAISIWWHRASSSGPESERLMHLLNLHSRLQINNYSTHLHFVLHKNDCWLESKFFFLNKSVTLAECEEDGPKWIIVWHDKTRSRSTVESIKVVQIRATISTRPKQKKDFQLTLFYRVEIRTTRKPQERSICRVSEEKVKIEEIQLVNVAESFCAVNTSVRDWKLFFHRTHSSRQTSTRREKKEREKGERWAFDLVTSWHQPAFNPSGLWACDEEKHRIIHFFFFSWAEKNRNKNLTASLPLVVAFDGTENVKNWIRAEEQR